LRSLSEQTDNSFEVVVAEDASSATTAGVVGQWSRIFGGRLVHVSQPDEGYRRARIIDLAALEATGDYVVFMDGDCVPRRGFVTAVRRAALPGWYLHTKRILLSEAFSRRVLAGEHSIWRWSALDWQLRAGSETRRPGYFVSARDRRRPWRPELQDFEPPFNAHGFFVGMWRADLERVNGWDARFEGWGNDDVDLAIRLGRIGLRCGWPGPRATLFHLWHPNARDSSDNAFLANEERLRETKASDRVEAVVGLRELAAQVTAKRATSSSASSEPA
jgi:glycosyltransferase involved in cell wall biosynthesis